MARFGINTEKAFGVSMAAAAARPRRSSATTSSPRALGDRLHEARFLPRSSTIRSGDAKQMDAWAADFNSWDLFDQALRTVLSTPTPGAEKVAEWAKDEREFVRRAAFATIAG